MSGPPRAQQLRLRENQLFLILTIVIGIIAGLAAVLFTVAIHQRFQPFHRFRCSPFRRS